MSLKELKVALEARGVQLNAECQVQGIQLTDQHLIPSVLRELYSVFDGFPEGVVDPSSGIRVWTCREVIENQRGGPVEFADFLMGSETFAIDSDGRVVNSAGETVAMSVTEFLVDISAGKHDFL